MRIESNVTYVERAQSPLKADFFLPESPVGGPLVMFCHGGGWISGDRSMYAEEALWFAGHGIRCATVDYRLAPLNVFPACVADLQAFVEFARSKSEDYGFDSTRVLAVGNSAGGHLAAMLALCTQSFSESGGEFVPVNGAVAICPITDLTEPRKTHFPISWSFVEQFMGSLDAGPTVLASASPISYVRSDAPPISLIHGEEDDIVPLDQSKRLHMALLSVGAPSEFLSLPGEMHSFSLSGWNKVRATSLEFVNRFIPEGSRV